MINNLKIYNMKTNDNNLFDSKLGKLHKTELGYKLPKDYFEKSKQTIFDNIVKDEKVKVLPLYKNRVIWTLAASIALVITLTIYKPNIFKGLNRFQSAVTDTLEQFNQPQLADKNAQYDDNVLLSSLFVSDENLDDFVDDYVYNETLNSNTVNQ